MQRIKLFIVCILCAFIALVDPNRVSQMFNDHKRMKKKREKQSRRKHEAFLRRMSGE